MPPHDLPRFWTPHLTGAQVDLTGSEAHHALHVLRLKAGDAVELFDGRGNCATGQIAVAGRSEIRVEVQARLPETPASRPAVCVAFAVPKGKRLDWLLEKATELGATSLRPVIFERSVAGGDSLSEGAWRRWQDHCVAAAKQSGLDRLPEIHQPCPLAELLGGAAGGLRLLGSADPAAEGVYRALPAEAPEEVMILVGPEGGLTSEESERAAGAGFRAVRLGQTVLRVETAAVALLAAVKGRW